MPPKYRDAVVAARLLNEAAIANTGYVGLCHRWCLSNTKLTYVCTAFLQDVAEAHISTFTIELLVFLLQPEAKSE